MEGRSVRVRFQFLHSVGIFISRFLQDNSHQTPNPVDFWHMFLKFQYTTSISRQILPFLHYENILRQNAARLRQLIV